LPQSPDKEDILAKLERSKSPLPKRQSILEPKARTVSRKIVNSSYATSSPTEERESKPRREATFKEPSREYKEK